MLEVDNIKLITLVCDYRVHLTKLRSSQKKYYSFPLCACGAVETVSHYLTKCPIYQSMSDSYINDLPCAPTLENLLFGNDRLTPDAKSSVFLKVQRFIAESKRFDA